MMKVFIIAALTADGFIGKDSDHFPDWTSKEDKTFFSQMTKEAGVMIMGRKTYDTIGRPLPGRKTIVYTRSKDAIDGVECSNESPEALVARLQNEGYSSVAICGGQSIYTHFMQSGVVTDVYLTTEPVVFGAGMPLFQTEVNVQLIRKKTIPLSDQTVVSHYTVQKADKRG